MEDKKYLITLLLSVFYTVAVVGFVLVMNVSTETFFLAIISVCVVMTAIIIHTIQKQLRVIQNKLTEDDDEYGR